MIKFTGFFYFTCTISLFLSSFSSSEVLQVDDFICKQKLVTVVSTMKLRYFLNTEYNIETSLCHRML